MRAARYLFIFLLVLVSCYSIGWFYLANTIVKSINNRYASQKIPIPDLVEGGEYFVAFDKAGAGGFPFSLAINLYGWTEESKNALIRYRAPLNIGYSLTSQAFYISYNGEIDAAYKPIASGFGAILKIRDYAIKASFPFTWKTISAASKIKDPIELINYIREISISSGEVKILDKQEEELFYDKEYEKLKISFESAKYYQELNDLIDNIPKEYEIHYSAKTLPVKFDRRAVPTSLFYGFFLLPSDFKATGYLSVKTDAKTIKELSSDLEGNTAFDVWMPGIELTSFKMDFKNKVDPAGEKNTKILAAGNLKLKEGLFEELFKEYELVKPRLISIPGGNLVNQEMNYIIANREAFRFKELENNDYTLNIEMDNTSTQIDSSLKLINLSIYSPESGFKLTSDSVLIFGPKQNWHTKGSLLIKNYPAMAEFGSIFIYRFGKFRFLDERARALYANVNTKFLKQISDYPASVSQDLSFAYSIDSGDLRAGKVGSVTFAQIPALYQLELYKNLFALIDPSSEDILSQVKNILPDLDENEPVFKSLLHTIASKNPKGNIRENKFLPAEDGK